jgi:hypothetical protein
MIDEKNELALLRGLATTLKSGVKVLMVERDKERRDNIIFEMREMIHVAEVSRGKQFGPIAEEMEGFLDDGADEPVAH